MAELDKQLNKCMKEEAFVLQSLKVKSYWSYFLKCILLGKPKSR